MDYTIYNHPSTASLCLMPKDNARDFLQDTYGDSLETKKFIFSNDQDEGRFAIHYLIKGTQNLVAATEPNQPLVAVKRQLTIPFV
jgi:hypothetical protein